MNCVGCASCTPSGTITNCIYCHVSIIGWHALRSSWILKEFDDPNLDLWLDSATNPVPWALHRVSTNFISSAPKSTFHPSPALNECNMEGLSLSLLHPRSVGLLRQLVVEVQVMSDDALLYCLSRIIHSSSSFCQTWYPELLKTAIILNAPSFFSYAWRFAHLHWYLVSMDC